jgi:hypothetical protein
LKHRLSPEDVAFLEAFEACRLSKGTFHHREHIQLAYIVLARHPLKEAYPRFKALLLKFLEANGIEESKYHETMTYAWLLAVRHCMQQGGETAGSAPFIEANPMLLDTSILFTHYTRERLLSDAAREAFVEPDLAPIPQ